MKRAAAFGALAALLVPSSGAVAQFAPGARSVGMGGAGMVFARGVDAVELNPANLAWAQGWNVSVFELGGATLSTGAKFDEIMAIFGADLLGSGDLNVGTVVSGLPAEGITLNTVTEGYLSAWATGQGDVPQPGSPLPSIGLTVGKIGLRVRSRVFAEATLSKELADLIGNGFVEQRIQEYSVDDTGFRTTSFSEITASYGTTMGGLLSVGIGARYVIGHSKTNGLFFEPVLDLTSFPNTLSLTSVAIESTSGTGYGLDVGLSMDLPGGFRASASGTNVIQRMNWDEALVAHTATYTDSDIDNNDFIDLLNRYDSQPITPNGVSLQVYEAAQGFFEESYFPMTIRGGVGWQSGGTSLEASGTRVSPRGRQRTAWDQRISLGVEQQIPILTLRAGMARASDGVSALTGGVGFRMGPVRLDTSAGKFGGDFEGSPYDGYYGTISLQIRGGGS